MKDSQKKDIQDTTFDIKKTVDYWVESATYDFETGKVLIKSKRYPYALFFGHLALEKILKALIVKATGQHAPYSHSLTFLADKTTIEIPETTMDRLAEYIEFHIESRYPDENREFYNKCSKEFTILKYNEIEEVCNWLTKKLEM